MKWALALAPRAIYRRIDSSITDCRNPRFLQGFSGFSVFKAHFAIFASAVSTSEDCRSAHSERLPRALQNLLRHVACCPLLRRRHLASSSVYAMPTASLLTRSMILSTPVLAPVRWRPWLISRSCGDVISDQGSRRALKPLGHGRLPLGGCAIGCRNCGRTIPGAPYPRVDHVRTLIPAL
jgi:hypothetical protein